MAGAKSHLLVGHIFILSTLLVFSLAWPITTNQLKAILRERDSAAAARKTNAEDNLGRSFRWAPSEIDVDELIEQLSREAAKNRVRQTRSSYGLQDQL
jgi:hypothetical protein